MEFNQIHTFYVAAKNLNFTRAAEELSISQPAVSRHIEALEQLLNIKLFHRVGRSVALTEAGKILFTYSEQILELVKRATNAINCLNNLESGSISVGASTTIGNYFLAPVVMKFMKQFPGIQVKMDVQSSQKIQNKIQRNLLDIAILPGPITSPMLTKKFLLEDQLVLVTPVHHPLLTKVHTGFGVKELKDEVFLTRGAGSNTRYTIEQYFLSQGIEFSRSVELNSTEAIKQAIISGAGISMLSARTILMELKLGVMQTIDTIQTTRQFYIVHHTDAYISPAIEAFIAFMKMHCATEGL